MECIFKSSSMGDHCGWRRDLSNIELQLLHVYIVFPILVAIELWGGEMANQLICFHCDNMLVVYASNSLSANSPPFIT